jgi:hypothetical protein
LKKGVKISNFKFKTKQKIEFEFDFDFFLMFSQFFRNFFATNFFPKKSIQTRREDFMIERTLRAVLMIENKSLFCLFQVDSMDAWPKMEQENLTQLRITDVNSDISLLATPTSETWTNTSSILWNVNRKFTVS